MADVGIASRRKAETLIKAGLVTVNGKVIKLGDRADPEKDAIKVEGKLLKAVTTTRRYFAFYKPKGVISMLTPEDRDPEGRPTLTAYLSAHLARLKTRVFPVGRLGFNMEGLLLLTNDGAFSERVQKHPEVTRVFHIKVSKTPDSRSLERIRKGGREEDSVIRPDAAKVITEFSKNALLELVFSGPTNFDLKLFLEKRGVLVERIILQSIGHLHAKGLKPGLFKELRTSQAEALIKQPELGKRAMT